MNNLFKYNIAKKTLALSIFLLIVTILFSFTLSGCGTNYGEKLTYLGDNELYYTSNVTKSEADKLGSYLVKEEFYSRFKRSS